VSERAGRRTAVLVLAAAIVLTFAMAWPVVCHPTERIFGAEIVGRHHDPFTVMRQFAGAPVPLPYLQPATDWLGRAFALVLHPVAAFNLVVLLTFPLAALSAYLFARGVGAGPPAAALAGVAYAFAPFHLAQAAYHPHIAQVQWMPLFLLALWRSVHRATIGTTAGLLAAGAVTVLSNTYNVLLLAALAPCAAVLFSLAPGSDSGERPERRHLLATLGVLAATGAIGLLAAYSLLPSPLPAGMKVQRAELVEYGARWWSFLVPPVNHPLLGGFARRMFAAQGIGDGLLEQQISIGWGLLALAGVGLWSAFTSPASRRRAACLVGLAAIAAGCALAPGDRSWRLPLAWPSGWFYSGLPMFRAYARFALVVQLLVAVLAGTGLAALWAGARTRALALVLLALLAFEYAPLGANSRDVLPTSAHRWLSGQRQHAAVLDCAGGSLGGIHDGWLAGFPVGYLDTMVADCGEPELAPKLAALGYSHLIVRRIEERRYLASSRPSGLTRVFAGADADVFRVDAGPGPYLADISGFHRREYASGETWRWSRGHAAFRLTIHRTAGREAGEVSLALTLAAFGVPRQVAVSCDGQVVARLDVTPVRAVYRIGPVPLPPGVHEITIASDDPPVSPASLGVSPDRRRLGIQWLGWRVDQEETRDSGVRIRDSGR
jgi:hypothetical protein